MKTTQFQDYVQELITHQDKPSVLLIAPTGLGKTFAVTADIQNTFTKIVYAVPLRALGNDICRTINDYKQADNPVAVVHHGAIQESELFGEEVVVTTYDQVVCGVPGLPLSLPLKAGHAIAGALLMCRLIFDEAHLAWGISENALSILLAIIQFRHRHGLQTILQTATLPDAISELLASKLKMNRVLVGENGEVPEDTGLAKRNANRHVTTSVLALVTPRGTHKLDYTPLDSLLAASTEQVIYFANTVDRIQQTYDRLMALGVLPERVLVLHNRMPHKRRTEVEISVREKFGESATAESLILLTNQVAEAGLNISASVVVTDPAPVDTLVQRAGRCARWFREAASYGQFHVLGIPGLKNEAKNFSPEAKEYAAPYRNDLVASAMQHYPVNQMLSWNIEREWVNKAWGGTPEKAKAAVEKSLNNTAFALNLFDRAMQERQPGQIARAFREILSVEVAVELGNRVLTNGSQIINFEPTPEVQDLQQMLDDGKRPDTSSISLGKAYALLQEAGGNAAIIRWEDDRLKVRSADAVQVGDVLILPSSMAYLHKAKGLCFGNGTHVEDAILQSCWENLQAKTNSVHSEGHYQTLLEHTSNVMQGTFKKIAENAVYVRTLHNLLAKLEGEENANQLAQTIVQLTCIAVAFHDLGKADIRWQQRIRQLDPGCPDGLVGRSRNTGQKIGIPHTPPGYNATVEACRLLMGNSFGNAESLVRAIALAACRHHSSLFNPAMVQNYHFNPHPDTIAFVQEMLRSVNAPPAIVAQAGAIVTKAQILPVAEEVPLMLPNHDLFPIYALIGRAILIADREDAASVPNCQGHVTAKIELEHLS